MGSAASNCLKDDCPGEAELRALLKGAAADEDRLAWLEERLSDCEGCRERLERLSARSSETVAAVIGGESAAPSRSEKLEAVMENAKAGDFPGSVKSVRSSAGPDLGFLERETGDNSLGRLGKYRVAELVAEGGMGLVLRAEDPDLHREVAIKYLSPRLAQEKRAREMFLREARAAAGVEHENVLPIYLVENSSELPWFVMPLVGGGTLADRIESAGESGLELDEMLALCLKVSRGLAAAHGKGLIHRDIKPANIMLDEEGGNVWLADFGLVAAAETDGGGGSIAGTPGFMAPEVAAGENGNERSDLFSLGCVFFAMATGRQAFSGNTVEQLLEAVRTEEPAPFTERNGDVPNWFGELIGRLLSKDPDDRLETADELVAIFEAHIEERRKAGWRVRVWRRVRRGTAMAALVAGGIAAILWLLSVTGRTQGINRALAVMTGDGFSVVGRLGVHDSLNEAAEVAGDGGVIEIFGGELRKTQPIRIEGKALTIRAAEGDVPILSSVSEVSSLIWSDSDLTLEGLVLEQPLRPKKSLPSLVNVREANLRIRQCRLLSPNRAPDGGLGLLVGIEDCEALEMTGVEIQGRHSYGIGFKNRKLEGSCFIRLDQVVYFGPLLLLMYDERPFAAGEQSCDLKIEVAMENCSVMSGTLVHISSRGVAYPVTIRARRNAFDCRVGLLTNLGTNEPLARKLFRWEDRENVYAVASGMFFGQGRGTLGNRMPRTPATSLGWDDVADWFGLEDGGSRRVDRIFTEESWANFQEKGYLDLRELEIAEDFPGGGTGFGADLGRIGPRRRN